MSDESPHRSSAAIGVVAVLALLALALSVTMLDQPASPPEVVGACPASPQQFGIGENSSGVWSCTTVSGGATTTTIINNNTTTIINQSTTTIISSTTNITNQTTIHSTTNITNQTTVNSTTNITSQEVAVTCSTHSLMNVDNSTGGGCRQPDWTDLTNIPNLVNTIVQGANAAMHGAISFVNSTSIGVDQGVSSFTFKLLSQACSTSPQQYVKGIGNAISCAQIDIGQLTGDIVNSITVGVDKLVGALTYTATSPVTVGHSGNTVTWACSTCVTTATHIVNSLVQGSNTAIFGALSFVNSTYIGFDQGVSSFKAVLQDWACTSGQYSTGVASHAPTCAQVAYSQLSGTPTIVNSLNALTGALSITSTGSSLTVGASGSSVNVDFNLGHSNTWTATQTFSPSAGNAIVLGATLYANSYPIIDTSYVRFSSDGLNRIVGSGHDMIIQTANAALDNYVTRIVFSGGAAQGAAGITSYEPWNFQKASTLIFQVTATGIGNTQGFQSFSVTLTAASTTTTASLSISEPDGSYQVVCSPTTAMVTISLAAPWYIDTKGTTSFVIHHAIPSGTETMDCIITHQ